MLSTFEMDPQSRRSLFFKEEVTWLVSELEHKRWVQDQLFKEQDWLPEDRVLRANEFWSRLLTRQFPHLQIVSPMFFSTYLRKWLEKKDYAWAKGEGSVRLLQEYLDFFLPILIEPSGPELLKDWMHEQEGMNLRWGQWFDVSCNLWQDIQAENFLLAQWAPAYLLKSDVDIQWSHDLLVDLGPSLTAIEVQLLQKLASTANVKVLVPNAQWRRMYPKVLWPYQLLLSESLEEEDFLSGENLDLQNKGLTCRRYVTELAEVRACVDQVRKWLEAGVKPSEISVIAADPEHFWPVLSPYLAVEGIPVAKGQVCVAHSLASVGKWMASMRVRVKALSSEDYEMDLFSASSPLMPYAKFREAMTNLYSESDLLRLKALQGYFEGQALPREDVPREVFLAWALERWESVENAETIQPVVSRFLLETPVALKLDWLSWVNYIQAIVSKTEVLVAEGVAEGVQIRKLSAVYMGEFSYQIFLGHNEAALSEVFRINVTAKDVYQLGQDLGFFLNRPDSGKFQLLTQWCLQSRIENSECETVLSYSQSDFSGRAQSGSFLWMQLAQHLSYGEKIETQFSTRWDELQGQDFDDLSLAFGSKKRLLQDQGLESFELTPPLQRPSLSASKLEDYLNCPFKFSAGKLMGLQPNLEVDLDLDRLTSGRLFHKCFELLLEPEVEGDAIDLPGLVDRARREEGLHVDAKLWPLQRAKLSETLQEFLRFESSWRQEFPETRTLGRELGFKGEWKGFQLRGKIDRVDTNSKGQYVVIDYKSSGNGLTFFPSWLKNNRLQLLVYVLAVERGWTTLPPGEVVGAFYFNVRDWNRDKGLGLIGCGAELFADNPKKSYALDRQTLQDLMHEFEEKMEQVTSSIMAGELSPNPENIDVTCSSCDWRSLCRAPHLNL